MLTLSWAADWGYVLAIVLTAVYALAIYGLHRKGWLGRDKRFSLLGPLLMIKTPRGRNFLERVAYRSRRFWNAFGDIGIVLALGSMIFMVVLLVWEAIKVTQINAPAPAASEAIGLPGINPVIPIGYGILALIIAVGLHELCHGVLARANDIKIKTLGVLFCVVPVGAFVEQDDDEMRNASARRRDRVAAAGVMSNFVMAIGFFLALSLVVSSSVHTEANGVGVEGVISGTPAQNISLQAGDIIVAVNGTQTPNLGELREALGAAHPGQTVPLTYFDQSSGTLTTTDVKLTSVYAFESEPGNNASVNATEKKSAFLGVAEYPITPQNVTGFLTDPFGPVSSGLTGPPLNLPAPLAGGLFFLALPFADEQPVQGSEAKMFSVSGPLGALPDDGAWVLINTLYWLVWMNILLGLTNALPAVPLDGGFLFRDAMTGLVKRVRGGWSTVQIENAVGRLSLLATIVIFGLILWQFVGLGR